MGTTLVKTRRGPYLYRNHYWIKEGVIGDWFIGSPKAGTPLIDDDLFWFACAKSEDQARQAVDSFCDILGIPSDYGPSVPACERMLREAPGEWTRGFFDGAGCAVAAAVFKCRGCNEIWNPAKDSLCEDCRCVGCR